MAAPRVHVLVRVFFSLSVLAAGARAQDPDPELVTVGDVAYFLGRGPGASTGGMGLWRADGRLHTVTRVRLLPKLPRPRLLTRAGNRLFFVAEAGGPEVWTSDGTPEGTRRVTDIAPGALWSDPKWLTVVDGSLFFSADDGMHGRELWKVPEQ
jgi:ELWxxDGT repeat protein